MLTHLLGALFGTRTPSDLARSTQGRWEDWLRPISDAAPVGTDPGYDDGFLAIKDEVARLSDIDDTLIVDTAERLLKHTSKDVRVAAFYVYGRMRRDGAEGVASGFELLSALVDRFGETLLPARAEARKAALEWLAGGTFADRLDRVPGLSGELLERTLSALALIVERTASWSDSARPELNALFRRFEGRVEVSQPSDDANREPSSGSAPSVGSLPPVTGIASTRELLDHARQMAQFLREQSQGYLAAYRLMRCVRWDTLTEVPPSEVSGKTRLLAPRTELRAHLKRLMLQRQWPELLERVEAAFAEGANHFWLDLQYYAFTAQEQAGGEYAQFRDQAATDCALMLERLPGLDRLAFSDGSPFADDTTLEWIARYATVRDVERGETVAPVSVQSANTDWAETEAQAADMVAQQGLDAAFAWLQRLPAQDGERDRFVRLLVMARVAERADRADTAVHLLSTLADTAQRFQLATWEPSLAFEAGHHLLRLLKIRANRKDADKAALTRRIEVLMGELTAIDPARAIAIA
ncbi:type VI secretion system ImpA domain-containing protein [Paraburkholderia acidicola]|uniref:Type VI secretion system ImpA domain-containing protein n=1 Tax=Paraburkholderia acidicola TaxID=1912599 RepID=A0A2A4F0B9_9BURK|nr:type VI secretion system protein TssA [Paraburkholderia acidicola]PCE27313.1 type VI secretion system ImpA domain-containing protein [Paraburkholderia acidicola]